MEEIERKGVEGEGGGCGVERVRSFLSPLQKSEDVETKQKWRRKRRRRWRGEQLVVPPNSFFFVLSAVQGCNGEKTFFECEICGKMEGVKNLPGA